MRVLTLLACLLVPVAVAAQERQIVMGSLGCGAVAEDARYQSHVVYLGSEGTAWANPQTHVWITVFNPASWAQFVSVTLRPDGGLPLPIGFTLAAYERRALYANDLFPANQNTNFATEIQFTYAGAASMATWTGNYSSVVYNTLAQGCDVPIFTRPYQVTP